MKSRWWWTLPPALALVYLAAWPVNLQPVAWQPQPAPSLESAPWTPNERLKAVQRVGAGLPGPEAVSFDDAGRLYTGLEDGRVLRIDPRDGTCRTLADTGGRPLGVQPLPGGAVAVADARLGLLRIEADGGITTLAERAEGVPLGFVDDVAADAAGQLYFSDASWKFGYGQHKLDALEHGARGRLLRWQPDLDDAVTLMAGLQFANGVALGPNEDYVLVNQTSAYQVTRYWLKTARAGTRDVFADNLPGFPDNITFNGRDRFWVALFAPRNRLLDRLAPYPFWRLVIARLPAPLMPRPAHLAFIVGLDLEGRVAEQYRATGADDYAPITSVREHGGFLYLGSLTQDALGRVRLDDLRDGGHAMTAAEPLALSCDG